MTSKIRHQRHNEVYYESERRDHTYISTISSASSYVVEIPLRVMRVFLLKKNV